MREKLFELEVREGELRQRFQPGHALLKITQKQRQELQEIVDQRDVKRTRNTTGLNPIRQAFELERQTAAVELAANTARKELLTQQARTSVKLWKH